MIKKLSVPLFAVLLGVGGCSSTMVEPSHYSGFLGDYSRLSEQKSPSGEKVARWVDPKLDLSRYGSVYIEMPQFYPKPQPTEQISSATLDSISRYYGEALRRELSKVTRVSNTPNSDSLVIRPAITAVATSNEGLKPYEVIPIGLIIAGTNMAAGGRDQQVLMSTEAAFLDASNSRVVAQVVRQGLGESLENKETKLSVASLKPLIDSWANDLRVSYEQMKKAGSASSGY